MLHHINRLDTIKQNSNREKKTKWIQYNPIPILVASIY